MPIPARPGRPRTDYEYERNGTANIFLLFAPLEGWRHVEVTDRHAGCITPTSSGTCQIAGIRTPRRSPSFRIISARTNPPRSMKAFPPAEARRLVERFEWHYTPKHGSWLNMAETELSVLSSQCLDRRIATQQRLTEEVAAWEAARNKHHAKADWQFTTADARTKLKRLYPSI